MPNTTSWREIRNRRPPNETAAGREKLQLRLAMLREQVGASQIDVAEAIGTSQSNVSQLERSNDQMLSSIARYVHALGGELKVVAVIGDAAYTLLDDVEGVPRQERTRTARTQKASTSTKAVARGKSPATRKGVTGEKPARTPKVARDQQRAEPRTKPVPRKPAGSRGAATTRKAAARSQAGDATRERSDA